MLRPFAHPVACCWMLLRVVVQSLKPVKLFSQQLPTFLLFCDRRSVSQQYIHTLLLPPQRGWIRLQNSSNIVGPRTLITHGVQRLMGCIFPTMHCRSQTRWELLHPFAHQCQHKRNNSQHVGSCCARLHAASKSSLSIKSSEVTLSYLKWPEVTSGQVNWSRLKARQCWDFALSWIWK